MADFCWKSKSLSLTTDKYKGQQTILPVGVTIPGVNPPGQAYTDDVWSGQCYLT